MGEKVKSLSPPMRILRWLGIHSLAALVLIFFAKFYRCPIRLIFNIPCPGCGLTRAFLSALKLDFAASFRYHPLFFPLAAIILYSAHRNLLKKRLSGKTETAIFFVTAFLFVAVYVIRLATGALPAV